MEQGRPDFKHFSTEAKLLTTVAIVSALKERGAGGFVAVSRVKPEIRDTAISQGVSVNKYIVLEKVRSMGKAPSAQEVRSESVKSILDRAGLAPKSVFPSGEGVRTNSGDGGLSTPGAPASGMNGSQPSGVQLPALSPAPQDGPQGRSEEESQESEEQSQSRDTSSRQNAPPSETSQPGTRPPASDLHDDRKEKTENGEERDSSQNEKEKPSGQSDDEEGKEPPEVE